MVTFKKDAHTFKQSNGISLSVTNYYPKKSLAEIKYHFYISHGASEYSKRHEPLYEYLMNHYQGSVCLTTLDHQGHGRSGGQRSSVENFDDFSNDFIDVINAQQFSYSKEVKHFIIGHSMGGLIVLNSLLKSHKKIKKNIEGIILSNPCIKPHLKVPDMGIDLLEKFPANLLKTRLPIIYYGKELTNDIKRAQDFDTDPLVCKFISLRLGMELLRVSKEVRAQSYYLNLPCLFLLSDDDVLCDPEMTKLFASGIRKDLVDIIDYKNCKHELFNEIIRDEVFKDLCHWIDSKFAA